MTKVEALDRVVKETKLEMPGAPTTLGQALARLGLTEEEALAWARSYGALNFIGDERATELFKAGYAREARRG